MGTQQMEAAHLSVGSPRHWPSSEIDKEKATGDELTIGSGGGKVGLDLGFSSEHWKRAKRDRECLHRLGDAWRAVACFQRAPVLPTRK